MNCKPCLTALALAGACGLSAAQSSVTVFGTVDAAAGRFKGAATGVNAVDQTLNRLDGGGMSTSHIGFRGAEDLGGGWTASFELATFIRNDIGLVGRSDAVGPPVNVAADPFWSRASWVGVGSRTLGRVRLGNITTLLFFNSITSNAFGDSTVFSPLNLVTHIGGPQAGGTGWTNQVVYDSPNLAGFFFAVARTATEGQGGHNAALRVGYAQGPLAATAVWQSVKKNPATFADGTTPNNVKTWMVGGSYDFKVVKLFAHVGQLQNDGTETAPLDIGYRLAEISASVPIGDGFLLAGHALRKTSDTVGPVPATAAGGNVERAITSVGYDHYLSKRTDVYAMLMRDETRTRTLPAAPAPIVKASGTSYGLGLRHRF